MTRAVSVVAGVRGRARIKRNRGDIIALIAAAAIIRRWKLHGRAGELCGPAQREDTAAAAVRGTANPRRDDIYVRASGRGYIEEEDTLVEREREASEPAKGSAREGGPRPDWGFN